jgi:hypothetical protein
MRVETTPMMKEVGPLVRQSTIGLLLVFFLFLTVDATAQSLQKSDQSVSFTAAVGGGSFSSAFGYQYLWRLGKSRKFGLGLGVRLTNYFGSDRYYTTAPAKLTSGKTGPGVFFADDIPENIDSVLFKKTQVNALNLSIHLEYPVFKRFDLGFNIDAIGFSFGKRQDGLYFGNNGIGATTTAKPTGFNALLISDNDLGSLNSELYVKYAFRNAWGAKLGFQYLFTEYTTATAVQTTPDGQTNDRFRYKSGGISIGITHKF